MSSHWNYHRRTGIFTVCHEHCSTGSPSVSGILMNLPVPLPAEHPGSVPQFSLINQKTSLQLPLCMPLKLDLLVIVFCVCLPVFLLRICTCLTGRYWPSPQNPSGLLERRSTRNRVDDTGVARDMVEKFLMPVSECVPDLCVIERCVFWRCCAMVRVAHLYLATAPGVG